MTPEEQEILRQREMAFLQAFEKLVQQHGMTFEPVMVHRQYDKMHQLEPAIKVIEVPGWKAQGTGS